MMETKIPEKVYKYRDWSNGFHRNILLHNELYLASPREFNDPFDFRIPMNFIDQTPEERNIYINDLAISHFYKSEEKGLNFKKQIEILEGRITNDKSFQTNMEDYYFDLLNKHYGILSMSTKWNEILLWSHYANQHKGFCVGFWEDKLRESTPFVSRTGLVDYPPEFPIIKPIVEKTEEQRRQRISRQTTTKSKDWEYEGEYRFVKCFYPEEPKTYQRLMNFQDNCISEIIMGISIPTEARDEIIQICKIKNIPVYQAKKFPFKFAIDRELIE